MKTLYLARHAKSYWEDQSIPDIDRPLNKRGKRDAPFMGQVLKDKKVKPDLVLVSPAKRTKKTALAIAEKIGYPEKKILYNEDLYEASSNILIKIIKKLDEKYDSVMIFGHNPKSSKSFTRVTIFETSPKRTTVTCSPIWGSTATFNLSEVKMP